MLLYALYSDLVDTRLRTTIPSMSYFIGKSFLQYSILSISASYLFNLSFYISKRYAPYNTC